MNILRVTRQFSPSVGGVESVAYGLSRALQQVGHRNDVVTLRTIFNTGESAAPEERLDGIQVYRLPHIGSRRYPIAPGVFAFARSYDLIHIHAVDFFVDGLSLTRPWHGRPLVVNTHGGIFHTRWFWPLKRAYFHTVTRLILRGVAAVICDSAHDRALFRAIVPAHKLRVIHNGVDLQPFLAMNKQVMPGRLLGIGRIAENKGVERLIALLPILAADFPQVHLVWVGEDPQRRTVHLRALAQQLGVAERVRFTGGVPQAELLTLLAQAHLFVSAASFEAFGVSTIEAMGSGTVPVVTPVGVHPEVIREGQTGFICRPELQGMGAGLRHALSLEADQLHQMGERARQAARRFAWEQVVKAYLDVYSAVLAQRSYAL